MVISTTGQGDLPSNARTFWKSLLRKKLSYGYLSDVCFTTFGLGDSSYPRYNWAARKLHKRLAQLGAVETYARGEGDEQHEEGLDASFIPWSAGLMSHLLDRFPLKEGDFPLPEHTFLEPNWLLQLDTPMVISSVETISNGESKEPGCTWEDNGKDLESQAIRGDLAPLACVTDDRIPVEVTENHRVTPDTHWQDVRHLTFTSNGPAPYGPGDVLTVYPRNSQGAVDEIIAMMDWGYHADEVIRFVQRRKPESSSQISPPITVGENVKMTLRYLLTSHLDVTAIPRRSFFSSIAHFTEDRFQKDRLMEFSDPKYIDELYDYTSRPRRSILEVLQEFESVKIPWKWVAHVIPELRGRQFSIASGGHLKTTLDGSARFELLVAIVKYKTVIRKIREGVCTKYLAGLRPGDQLMVSLQKGGLGMNHSDLRAPVIMIGPGTGIAPMRSLIWERMHWKKSYTDMSLEAKKDSMNRTNITTKDVLFFGCRNENADYFFRDEWAKLQCTEEMQVYPAFSRDTKHKYYVQDAILEHSHLVYQMLQSPDAIVYVCGSSGKMPVAVRAALVDVVRRAGRVDSISQGEESPVSRDAAMEYLEALERGGRYKQETW